MPEFENAFEPPLKIGEIEDRDTFSQIPEMTTENHGWEIKAVDEKDYAVHTSFNQFAEFLQKVCDFEAANSTQELFEMKAVSVLARHHEGFRNCREQRYHRDPGTPNEGQLFHLYLAASSAETTEYTLSKNYKDHGAEILRPEPYDINYFSMGCLHRVPALSKDMPRVLAGVLIGVGANNYTTYLESQNSSAPEPPNLLKRVLG